METLLIEVVKGVPNFVGFVVAAALLYSVLGRVLRQLEAQTAVMVKQQEILARCCDDDLKTPNSAN